MAALLSCLEALAPLGAALGLGWALRRTRVCSPADGEVGGLRTRCCEHFGCCWPLQAPTRLPSCSPPADRRKVRGVGHPALADPTDVQWVRRWAAGEGPRRRRCRRRLAPPLQHCRPHVVLTPQAVLCPTCRLSPAELPLPVLAGALLSAALTSALAWCVAATCCNKTGTRSLVHLAMLFPLACPLACSADIASGLQTEHPSCRTLQPSHSQGVLPGAASKGARSPGRYRSRRRLARCRRLPACRRHFWRRRPARCAAGGSSQQPGSLAGWIPAVCDRGGCLP